MAAQVDQPPCNAVESCARIDDACVGFGDAGISYVGECASFVAGGTSFGDGCPCLCKACRSFVRAPPDCREPSPIDVDA